MNDIDEDTSEWLGCPTPLEMYKHQCALLEDELIQTQAMLRKARANIAGLVQMNDILSTEKAQAETGLRLDGGPESGERREFQTRNAHHDLEYHQRSERACAQGESAAASGAEGSRGAFSLTRQRM